MHKEKIARMFQIVFRIVGIIGGLLILGAVGYDDCMTELGQYYPFAKTLIKLIIGIFFVCLTALEEFLYQDYRMSKRRY